MIKKKKFFTLSKSILAASLFVIMTSCGGKDAQQQAGMSGAGAAQVDTYKVALGSVNLNTSYPATIKGKMDIEIRPQISGFITKVCAA